MLRNRYLVLWLSLTTLIACGQEQGTAPGTEPAVLARAPGGGGKTSITVTAADPDTVPIDTTLTIRVLGSGFAPNATVEYLLAGTATTNLKALTVTFVSSSELRAYTQISADAALSSYDIAVDVGGKRGVGAEKVEVVAKPVDLPDAGGVRSVANDVNDAGVIVGWMTDASDQTFALRWRPQGEGWSAQVLGPGSAVAINNRGDVLRRDYDGTAFHTWILLSSGQEVDLGPGSYGHRIGDDGTVIGSVTGSGPAVWRQDNGWGTPITDLPTAPGYNVDGLYGLSENGLWISGELRQPGGQFDWGVVWHWDGTALTDPVFLETVNDGGARGVNNAGALAGYWWPCMDATCAAEAAYWPAAGAPRQMLPQQNTGMSGSAFNDINNANVMVGRGDVVVSNNRRGSQYQYRQPVLWTPGASKPLDLSAFRALKSGEAIAINNTGLAVGYQNDGGGARHAVAWILP